VMRNGLVHKKLKITIDLFLGVGGYNDFCIYCLSNGEGELIYSRLKSE
jgi:hypothetical protein